MERDQLIAEVARATGVRLDSSDPIIAAAVVHEALLNEALVKLDRQVTIQADRVTAASTQAVAAAKKEAELLLTDAGSWVEERMKAAAADAVEIIRIELQNELRAAQKGRRILNRAAWLGVVLLLTLTSGVLGWFIASLR